MQRPPIDPRPGDYKGTQPAPTEDAGDVLARVYALILSWPTVDEKRAAKRSDGDD